MKKYIIGAAILVLVAILGFSAKNILANGQDATNDLTTTGNVALSTERQDAKLSLVDFSYRLTPNTLKKGVPVRVEVDASTLSGCMKNVIIKDFGVRKTIRPGDNIIEFTPDKAGTFWITCSMGMGPGSFRVVDQDGKVDATAVTPPPSRPTGGCGCSGCGA